MAPPIRVLTVSDADWFIDLRDGHEIGPAIRFVGQAATAREAEIVLREGVVDVIVLDSHLRGDHADLVVDRLHRTHPDVPLVAVMALDDGDLAKRLVHLGVRTIVTDAASSTDFALAIRTACAGRSMIPPILLTSVLELLRSPEDATALRPPLDRLTTREIEVLQHMVDGASKRETAERLHVSINTVRTHVQNLLSKLGVHSSLEAVSVAIRAGLRPSTNGASY